MLPVYEDDRLLKHAPLHTVGAAAVPRVLGDTADLPLPPGATAATGVVTAEDGLLGRGVNDGVHGATAALVDAAVAVAVLGPGRLFLFLARRRRARI